jgi:hypothetical protein
VRRLLERAAVVLTATMMIAFVMVVLYIATTGGHASDGMPW